jgi:hypothetical protein
MPKAYAGYNEPHQTRAREPDAYENSLGDVLEFAFGRHIHHLEGIVAVLKERGVPAAGGAEWSVELLKKELARLGE